MLDQDKDQKINNVLILLTSTEASELKAELERLLASTQKDDHGHVNDSEFEGEISIAIYNENSIDGFDDRIKKLITEDK